MKNSLFKGVFKYALPTFFCFVSLLTPYHNAAAQVVLKNDSPTLFRTGEFNLGYQLSAVKADYAYGRGFAGSGQVVAIFDSGMNGSHADFQGQLYYTGYDALANTLGGFSDTTGHGTFVAGIIGASKNNYGMHGIAFESKLMPIRIVNPDGSINLSDTQLARGVYFATNNGARVFNNSWNSSATITDVSKAQLDYWMPKSLMAYRYALDRGAIVVFAAGNESKANPGFYSSLPIYYPELERGWVAVVATAENGAIASYSNRCGSSAGWCIAAPGTNLVSTYNNAYGRGSGTSFAAPVVSAAFAIMRQRWPHLTNQQIRDILFRTANKTGIYSNASIYGQGFLDLDKATAPVGGTSVATGSTVKSGTTTTTSTVASFGRGVRSVGGGDLPHMIVLDEYGRDYEVDTTSFFTHVNDSFDASSALAGFGKGMDSFTQGRATYAYSFTPDSKNMLTNAALDGMRLFIEAPLGKNSSLSTSFNVDPTASFGLAARDEIFSGAVVDDEALTNPYMTLAKNPVTFTARTMLTDDVWVKAGSFMGQQATDPSAPQTTTDDPNYISARGAVFGHVAEAGVKIAKKSGIALNAGFVQEEGAFLGSTSSGAASLADKTTTSFVAASAQFDLGGGLKAFGGFEMGWSDVKAASNSLVKDISGVSSQSFRVGLTKTGVVGQKDRLGFVISQPLRVNSGTASLDVPVARDAAGNLTTKRASLALGAEGSELDIQAFYGTEVTKDSSFSAGLLFRQNPGHADGGNEAVALARYKLSF